MKPVRVAFAVLCALMLSSCIVRVPTPYVAHPGHCPGGVWIPGHPGPHGHWIEGHWDCP